jgi:hypothetical protein
MMRTLVSGIRRILFQENHLDLREFSTSVYFEFPTIQLEWRAIWSLIYLYKGLPFNNSFEIQP